MNRRGRPPKTEVQEASGAQEYAMRVWHGQSIDLPHKVRVERVLAALEAQGLDTDVELPKGE
jgi:hypothetical protein